VIAIPRWSNCRLWCFHLYGVGVSPDSNFYWMCNTAAQIEQVKCRYEHANRSRFELIGHALKDCAHTWGNVADGANGGSHEP
jgi:hypothetical protein